MSLDSGAPAPQNDLLGQLALLYELSLSIGQSLELIPNCDRFLKALMARKDLSFASVWLWAYQEEDTLRLTYANPRSRCTRTLLSADEPLVQLTRAATRFQLLDPEAISGAIQCEDLKRLVIFPLGDLGVLLLGARYEAFGPMECAQLSGLMEKFTVSLDGCLAHQALSRAEARNKRLALVARHTDNAVVITDARSRIQWVNDGFTRMTGYPLHEIIGKIPGHFLQGKDTDPETVSRIRATLLRQESITEEILNYTRDGEPYWISMTITPIFDAARQLSGFIAIERDTTEVHQREDALLIAKQLLEEQALELQAARQAAELASDHKSRFLAQMSHELRTPLTAIIGYAELLTDDAITPQAHSSHLSRLNASATHLLELVSDVLDLSSIEAGEVSFEPQAIDPGGLVDSLVEVYRSHAARKGLALSLVRESEVPVEIMSDATRLRQILINLIANAIKYTPAGQITVRIGCAEGQLRMAVEDTGVGIAPDRLSELFEPFSRLSTTADRNSSGLGLSIVRKFADALGGQITVRSTPGEGSTFSLLLPLVEGRHRFAVDAAEPVVAEPEAPVELAGRRVLLVEDTPDLQRILTMYLKQAGAAVTLAVNGQDALDIVEEAERIAWPFELVMMDMQMPIMDGYAATRTLRERGFTRPIIASTAYAMPEDRRRCLDAGCTDWLGKPVRRAALHRILRKHLPDAPPLLRSTMADDGAFAVMLQMYFEDLTGFRAELEALCEAGEAAPIERLLHRLKGSAGSYGYPALSAAAGTAMDLLRAGESPESISGELGAVRTLIDAILRGSGGAS